MKGLEGRRAFLWYFLYTLLKSYPLQRLESTRYSPKARLCFFGAGHAAPRGSNSPKRRHGSFSRRLPVSGTSCQRQIGLTTNQNESSTVIDDAMSLPRVRCDAMRVFHGFSSLLPLQSVSWRQIRFRCDASLPWFLGMRGSQPFQRIS